MHDGQQKKTIFVSVVDLSIDHHKIIIRLKINAEHMTLQ